MHKIDFVTEDGIVIIANYWAGGEKAALLLHMMPATKESWNEFGEELNKIGFSVLAIDERGHGESTNGGEFDYKNFSDEEQQKKIIDVEAADRWLKKNDKQLKLLAGASIGANLALQYQTENNLAIKTVLLSAGFDYKGIKTKPFAENLHEPQGVFYIGAEKDVRSGGYSCGYVARELYRLSRIKDKKSFVSQTEKHGTDLFSVELELMHQILDWVKT